MVQENVSSAFDEILNRCEEIKSNGFKIVKFELPKNISNDVMDKIFAELDGVLQGFKLIDFSFLNNGKLENGMIQIFEKDGEVFKKYVLRYML
jgi:hypothetical protein